MPVPATSRPSAPAADYDQGGFANQTGFSGEIPSFVSQAQTTPIGVPQTQQSGFQSGFQTGFGVSGQQFGQQPAPQNGFGGQPLFNNAQPTQTYTPVFSNTAPNQPVTGETKNMNALNGVPQTSAVEKNENGVPSYLRRKR